MISRLAVLAVVLAITPPVAASQDRNYDIIGVTVWRMEPTADLRAVWDSVVACAGQVKNGGSYEQIVWFVGNLTERDPKHQVIGTWMRPDTIVLDTAVLGWPTDVRVPLIAHEMLHHRLQRPRGASTHPVVPFYQPCQLMVEQFLNRDPDYRSPWWGWDQR